MPVMSKLLIQIQRYMLNIFSIGVILKNKHIGKLFKQFDI